MQNSNRWIKIILILVAVLLLGTFVYSSLAGPAVKSPTVKNSKQNEAPKIYTFNAEVRSIKNNKYTFSLKDGDTLTTFAVPSSVMVVKRVNTSTTSISVKASFSDISTSSKLMMYSVADPYGMGTPHVTKIEIIN